MRDNQRLMVRFSKIVERHPEIYDQNLDAYKTRQVEAAWEKVAHSVRTELQEECTVAELKIKWKGIRSSYNRYKNKLINGAAALRCKRYYLYDTLRFLDPFTRPKGFKRQGSSFCGEFGSESDEESKVSTENNPVDEWSETETKTEIIIPDKQEIHRQILPQESSTSTCTNCESAKKRKYSSDDDNEDLQFFKSILPEIKNYTNKEKRKFKMAVLRLIDDIENERENE